MTKRTSYTFNPFELTGVKVPRENKEQALSDVADYVRDSILEYVADGKSPVAGFGNFAKLSKGYKKFKDKEGGTPVPNLELQGDLLQALDRRIKGNQIEVGIFDSDQYGKAEGNNLGTYGGDKEKTPRRFIPLADRDETFKRQILSGIESILESYAEEE